MSWRLAKSLAQLAAEVDARWPGTTIWAIGDQDHAARASDHNPNGAGVVCAIDVLGHKQSDALWAFLGQARDPRVKYAIHDQRIMSASVSPWQARRYRGSNPHTNHIHISVGRGRDGYSTRADLYDDPDPWGLTRVTTDPEEDDVYVVRHGNKKKDARVQRAQRIVQAAGREYLDEDLLPQYGADGYYGDEMAGAVDRLAGMAKIPKEGDTGMDVLVLDYARHLLTHSRREAAS